MAVIAIGSMSYATQTVAAAYGYHPALGASAFGNMYWPWKVFAWSQTIADSHGILEQAMNRAQLVFIIPANAVPVRVGSLRAQAQGQG